MKLRSTQLTFYLIATCSWFSLITCSLFSQGPDLGIEKFTFSDGISDLRVIDIIQDSIGMMWFGTWNGLNRYDGYTFKTYQHDPNDSASIPFNYVEIMFLDSKGNLWLGFSREGSSEEASVVGIFNPKSETFVPYEIEPEETKAERSLMLTSIEETHDGMLWFGFWGEKTLLVRLNPENGDINTFSMTHKILTLWRMEPFSPSMRIDNKIYG